MNVPGASTSDGGAMKVSFETASVYLSHELPHVVRDANLRVVAEAHGNHTYRLPAGLYRLEAVTPTGRRTSSIVTVTPGDIAEVTIGDLDEPATSTAGGEIGAVASPPQAVAPQVSHPTQAPSVGPSQPAGSSAMCSTCGSSVDGSDVFCPTCGAFLEWSARAPGTTSEGDASAPAHEPGVTVAHAPSEPKVRPPAPPRSAGRDGPATSSTTCHECGSPVVDGRVFCPKCGTVLEPIGPAPEPRGGWWGRLLSRWSRRRRTVGSERGEVDDAAPATSTHSDVAVSEPSSDIPVASAADPPPRVGSGSRHRAGPAWQVDGDVARLRDDDVRLVRASGCVIQDVVDDQLVFRGAGHLDEPAFAVFEFADRKVHISLPVHFGASFPLDAATVTAARAATGSVHLVAGFPPERRVARVIDTMASNGSIVDADAMVRQSSELLLHKYSDPPAAAMGALILHRLGRLDERESWVRNLATDFPWLPDGVALYASVLRDGDADERSRGLDLLLDATTRRPLYTDGLSLMVSLLRRWPGDERLDERRNRIEALAGYLVTANLDEMCLTCIFTTRGSDR